MQLSRLPTNCQTHETPLDLAVLPNPHALSAGARKIRRSDQPVESGGYSQSTRVTLSIPFLEFSAFTSQ